MVGRVELAIDLEARGNRELSNLERVSDRAAKRDHASFERAEARASRDFGRADAIRERLTAMGVVIEDSAQGARWRLAS